MKRISKIVLAAFIATGVWSCQDDDNLMFTEPVAGDFVLNTPGVGTAIVLTEDMPQDNIAATFTWDAVEYTTPTEVTYELQFAKNGTDFAEPMTMSSSTLRSYSITNAQLNNAALAMELTPEEPNAIDVRVIATIGTTGSEPKISNVLTFVVTPYPSNELINFYLVGDATEFGWNNNNANGALFRDGENLNLYHYTGYFNTGGFKVLSALASWHPQYGSASAGVLGVSNPDGSNEPGSFNISTAGYYTFTMDVEAMTYTLDEYNASAAPTFTSVGIIGTGTIDDWNSDQNLVNSAQNPHIWKATGVELTAENIKFRANDSWDLPGNWGGGTLNSGQVAVNGGDFLGVEIAGSYTIYFNDLDGRYVFILE
ncbi:SusE domain-containing protein [Flavobacterium selenitireducens]|uniref:SusE domain-containing protein n=1 Tax=Flavobacterium selenitireducens TaxID=2722704 RepID=UPI00168AA625|nr:SusE domain-containing protein [Flavobacterium selenitireducens]MBD3583121.1 SusF/SusE family outer membrane protein [Flavobacterium selenitireducens]